MRGRLVISEVILWEMEATPPKPLNNKIAFLGRTIMQI